MTVRWSEEELARYMQHRGIPRAPAHPVSEKVFQAAVVRLAREHGWLVHTTYDSRKSPAGYPDLTLCRGPELLIRELKIPGGVLTLQQHHWLEDLQRVTHVEAGVWIPDDMPHIAARLR